ncbi:hypothetical protein EXIGLDRAFT_736081 [Exidia glandulosa HHB12029]|uniref:Uncharacterized protein n=1 Tax=Exidia glandulosa HHB12029 TaxID=1314781 RepID=A0A165JLH6_EXIGL|nr:hypothetical protein EXIGLDRAFT_736081 [Exidia glandulosa HHB12029]
MCAGPHRCSHKSRFLNASQLLYGCAAGFAASLGVDYRVCFVSVQLGQNCLLAL